MGTTRYVGTLPLYRELDKAIKRMSPAPLNPAEALA